MLIISTATVTANTTRNSNFDASITEAESHGFPKYTRSIPVSTAKKVSVIGKYFWSVQYFSCQYILGTKSFQYEKHGPMFCQGIRAFS